MLWVSSRNRLIVCAHPNDKSPFWRIWSKPRMIVRSFKCNSGVREMSVSMMISLSNSASRPNICSTWCAEFSCWFRFLLPSFFLTSLFRRDVWLVTRVYGRPWWMCLCSSCLADSLLPKDLRSSTTDCSTAISFSKYSSSSLAHTRCFPSLYNASSPFRTRFNSSSTCCCSFLITLSIPASKSASPSQRKCLPGSAYIEKIHQFIDLHYEYGELYMDFLKGACQNHAQPMCSFCISTPWKGPVIGRVPRPLPDHDKLPSFHYKCVYETPNVNEDGVLRCPDDFMPRAQLRKAFEAGDVKIDQPETITQFSKRFIVSEEYVSE